MTDPNADPSDYLRTQLATAQDKVRALELRLAEFGVQNEDLPKVTKDDLVAYSERMVQAIQDSDDDAWDAIFIEYMKDMLVRERDMDPYVAIASFVRGSMRAAMEFGRRLAQSSTEGSN